MPGCVICCVRVGVRSLGDMVGNQRPDCDGGDREVLNLESKENHNKEEACRYFGRRLWRQTLRLYCRGSHFNGGETACRI